MVSQSDALPMMTATSEEDFCAGITSTPRNRFACKAVFTLQGARFPNRRLGDLEIALPCSYCPRESSRQIDHPHRLHGNGQVSRWKSFGTENWISSLRHRRNYLVQVKNADRGDLFNLWRRIFSRPRNGNIAFIIRRRTGSCRDGWRHRPAWRECRSFKANGDGRLA